MRAIMVMYDSLNRRMLEPYGCNWVKTPNFTRLAEHSVTFDNCYVGSMPCMPARRELHTGRYNFLHRSWGPLEPFDDSMPDMLKKHGVYSHMISDHYHYWEDGGATYHSRYSSWELVRGQEVDPWKGYVHPPKEPAHLGPYSQHNEVNRKLEVTEADYPQTKVFDLGLEFLEHNLDADNWFLQIETFDPHEPYTVPDSYKSLYPDDYDGPRFDWPPYGRVTESEAAVGHIRNKNAALVSMCDRNLGRVLDFMDKHDMWRDTMLIVNTDHGFLLGEHDVWAKCVHPLYNEVSHIPFFVWDPTIGVQGERRQALTQTIDIAPTLLHFFGLPLTKDMRGAPLQPVLERDSSIRKTAIYGVHGGQLCITDGRYVAMFGRSPDWNGVTYNYTLIPTHMRDGFILEELRDAVMSPPFDFTKSSPVMKIPFFECDREPANKDLLKTMLFDLATDPRQEKPFRDAALEKQFAQAVIAHLEDNDAPAELYEMLAIHHYL